MNIDKCKTSREMELNDKTN